MPIAVNSRFATKPYVPRPTRSACAGPAVPAPARPGSQAHNSEVMSDVSHAAIDELDAVGFLEGFTFRRVGAELGVTPFGMSIIDMPAGTTAYPAHDHVSEGPGNPPAHQLGPSPGAARPHSRRPGSCSFSTVSLPRLPVAFSEHTNLLAGIAGVGYLRSPRRNRTQPGTTMTRHQARTPAMATARPLTVSPVPVIPFERSWESWPKL